MSEEKVAGKWSAKIDVGGSWIGSKNTPSGQQNTFVQLPAHQGDYFRQPIPSGVEGWRFEFDQLVVQSSLERLISIPLRFLGVGAFNPKYRRGQVEVTHESFGDQVRFIDLAYPGL